MGSSAGVAAVVHYPQQATYSCKTKWAEEFPGFELKLSWLASGVQPHLSPFAQITANDGTNYIGNFAAHVIPEGTRLSGYTEYLIETLGGSGVVELSLIDSGSLWGNGVINLDGSEKTILVTCVLKQE